MCLVSRCEFRCRPDQIRQQKSFSTVCSDGFSFVHELAHSECSRQAAGLLLLAREEPVVEIALGKQTPAHPEITNLTSPPFPALFLIL